METIHCSECGEFVKTIRKETSKNTSEVKKACDCKERPNSVFPYEVTGWEWISFDG